MLWKRLDLLAQSYLDYKSKTLSANSLRAYRNVMRHLDGRRLTRQRLDQIINAPGSHGTRQLRRNVLSDFQKWLIREGHASRIIPTEVTSRPDRRPIRIITEPELLELCNNHPGLADVLKVGFYMGLRISEIVHCRPAWVIDGRFLRIGDLSEWNLPDEFHPKSQKEHDEPIAIPQEVSRIFRQEGRYERLFGWGSTGALRAALGRVLPTGFTPHHLRHSCISYWLNERRVPIQEVQRLARHSRIETTMRYYHPDIEAHWRAFN